MSDTPNATGNDEKQCRICLDGVTAERELGRLISPCQCKGSIRYVHVKCLQQWRNTSPSQSAFFACPQCHYQYRFARTQVVGLAGNPIVIAGISGLLFTILVMLASFVTTYFMSWFEEPSEHYEWSYFRIISPFEVATDLVSAAFRILRDGDVAGILEDDFFPGENIHFKQPSKPGFMVRFIRRFLLGLPLVGAASLVHLLLSIQILAPVQWLARYRASRRRNNNRDVAAIIVVGLIVFGAARALFKVYKVTEHYTKRLLLRAEDAILEVNS
ncbi:hypothetical protein D9611_003136 [Ephemerocybe angulata]|uniref:RING-CH-type domain-containing protein n=1 Tax=Ephemerocybe angulata TaxID=980116 RepID=A0A8H5C888_9AGAR|nr:hypothetical protein D9611_003136 [Tulosesus angulatus]